MRRTFLLILLAFAALPLRAEADDRDGDGLDDATEAMLLERHLPVLALEPDERYSPVSILDFVQRSALVAFYRFELFGECNAVPSLLVYPESQVSADPRIILHGLAGFNPPYPPGVCGVGDTSFVTAPNPPVRWRLDVNDAFRAPFAGTPQFDGVYGHVVPTGDGRILIQYWLLFAMNEAECNSDCGDHEGDWLYLDVYVSASDPYHLQSIVYHHHGDSNCAPITVPYPGIPLPPPLSGWLFPPVSLPADGHPVCYVEEQAHEWWPWASGGGECDFTYGFGICENASHYGGVVRAVTDAINVGEWYAPTPGDIEAELFVLYNGLWGFWGADCEPFNSATPPDSPMVQFFPAPPNWRFLSHGEPQNAVGTGTPTDPWRSFATAANEIGAGQTLRVIAGTYSAVGTWSRPMTITATLGPVTLGQ